MKTRVESESGIGPNCLFSAVVLIGAAWAFAGLVIWLIVN